MLFYAGSSAERLSTICERSNKQEGEENHRPRLLSSSHRLL
uniref:Uncharacterized protein n=1 Tax=Ciona intestinalis TaxID=7719 RepID=H2Y3D8_CIOIN